MKLNCRNSRNSFREERSGNEAGWKFQWPIIELRPFLAFYIRFLSPLVWRRESTHGDYPAISEVRGERNDPTGPSPEKASRYARAWFHAGRAILNEPPWPFVPGTSWFLRIKGKETEFLCRWFFGPIRITMKKRVEQRRRRNCISWFQQDIIR